jgi:hypothetical protein
MDAIERLAYTAIEKQAALFGEGQAGHAAKPSALSGSGAKQEMLSALERLRLEAVQKQQTQAGIAGEVGRAAGTDVGGTMGGLGGAALGGWGGMKGRKLIKSPRWRAGLLAAAPLALGLLGRAGGRSVGGNYGQASGEGSVAPLDPRLSKTVTSQNAPDVMSALSAVSNKTASDSFFEDGMEKEAFKKYINQGLGWLGRQGGKLFSKQTGLGPTAPGTISKAMGYAAPRAFSGKRTAATLGGLAATGYGGYGAHQFNAVRGGAYDTPGANNNPTNLPGWRSKARGAGQRSLFKDFFMNPGRTIAEGMGYGEQGPNQWQKPTGERELLREYRDPATGKMESVYRQPKEKQWRPDIRAAMDSGDMHKVMELGGEEAAYDLIRELGLKAGQQRRSYTGLPTPGPLTRDYSMYNYGI